MAAEKRRHITFKLPVQLAAPMNDSPAFPSAPEAVLALHADTLNLHAEQHEEPHCRLGADDEVNVPYDVKALFTVPIYRQKWIEHSDGTFSSSLALEHDHRIATSHSLVFDLGIVVILSSLTQRFHVNLPMKEAKRADSLPAPLSWLFEGCEGGGFCFTHTFWQINDVAVTFLPILYRWRTNLRMLNLYDSNDYVFLAIWAVETSLLVFIGTHVSCTTDPLCRKSCDKVALGMALWSVLHLVGFLYGVIANTLTPCVDKAVKMDPSVASRVVSPHARLRHFILMASFHTVYIGTSIVLWSANYFAWLAETLPEDECARRINACILKSAGGSDADPDGECIAYGGKVGHFKWSLPMMYVAIFYEIFISPFIFGAFSVFVTRALITKPKKTSNRPSMLSAMNLLHGADDIDDPCDAAASGDSTRALKPIAEDDHLAMVAQPVKIKHLLVPLNIDLIVERYGLLCILVLGEFIVAATKALANSASPHSTEPASGGGGGNHSAATPAPTPEHHFGGTTSVTSLIFGSSENGPAAGGGKDTVCFKAFYFNSFVVVVVVCALKVLYFELSDSVRPSSSKCQVTYLLTHLLTSVRSSGGLTYLLT